MKSPGVAVPPHAAEATRRRLRAAGTLRDDLAVFKQGDHVVFPVSGGDATGKYEFKERDVAPRDYRSLLPEELQEIAPRAHEVLGDIGILKVPQEAWPKRATIGKALQRFAGCRAVFHDHGVKGEFRTRELELIAGLGGAETEVNENGVRLAIDVTKAYYSPRLAEERRRVCGRVGPDATVIDLFGGVAPLGVQLAKQGCKVTTVDLNPAAGLLAQHNARLNGVEIAVVVGDARKVAAGLAPADHVVMNLPHGAKDFIDVAAGVCTPGGIVHYHEILERTAVPAREKSLLAELAGLGRKASVSTRRVVRDYSTQDVHMVWDLRLK